MTWYQLYPYWDSNAAPRARQVVSGLTATVANNCTTANAQRQTTANVKTEALTATIRDLTDEGN